MRVLLIVGLCLLVGCAIRPPVVSDINIDKARGTDSAARVCVGPGEAKNNRSKRKRTARVGFTDGLLPRPSLPAASSGTRCSSKTCA